LDTWLEENNVKLDEIADNAIDHLLSTYGLQKYLLPQQCQVTTTTVANSGKLSNGISTTVGLCK